mmetsp:Transcript_3110/g.2586  ORF Transcript_3110/g.2586 Transcript_3110/m.2586 type:complete len:129 (+) Transcript_3110:6-392(+)
MEGLFKTLLILNDDVHNKTSITKKENEDENKISSSNEEQREEETGGKVFLGHLDEHKKINIMESIMEGIKTITEMNKIDTYFKEVMDNKIEELLEKYKQEKLSTTNENETLKGIYDPSLKIMREYIGD